MSHIPVLLNEVVYYLSPSNGDNIIDATFGYGGHTIAILEKCKNCNVLGIDRDPDVIDRANQIKQKYKGRFNFIHGKFSEVLQGLDKKYNKILFDFGVSSIQLDNPERGFSFSKSGSIDMRMSKEGKSAYDIINTLSQEDLFEIIWKYGDENKSRKIAKAIVNYRNKKTIETTTELRNIILSVINNNNSHIDPSTKTFQALRIYVNDELNEIYKALNSLNNVLINNSIIVTISFHSLEDRIVKQWAKNNKKINNKFLLNNNKLNKEYFEEKIKKTHFYHKIDVCKTMEESTHNNNYETIEIIPINNKIIKPNNDEIKRNPRSRSAILRAYKYNIDDKE